MGAGRGARPRDDATLHHLGLDPRGDLPIAGEVLLGRAVFYQLDGREQPLAAPDVARVRVAAERLLESLVEPGTHRRRVLPEPLALHDLDVLQPDRAARRMAGIRVGVHPAVLRLDRVHGVLDRLADHDPTERQVPRGHALREREDVGLDVPVPEREPAPRPAEAGDDLVADQQHVVTGADFTHARPVVVGGIDDAAAAVDRLADERPDGVGALAQDRLLERARGRLAHALAGFGALEP